MLKKDLWKVFLGGSVMKKSSLTLSSIYLKKNKFAKRSILQYILDKLFN